MGKFLNPFTDVGFKKLFGQEVNKFLLIEFLNDLLLGEHHVVDISFLNKEIVPETFGGRVVMNNKLRQIYLSLPYFTLEQAECHTDFECWIYLLKNMETLERMPFEAKKAVFKKLLDVADVENMTPDERECYEESLKAYRDYVNTIATAERISREKALAEGEAKGKRQMAAQLKKEGLSTDMIVRCSGLSIEEIERL